jgi:hypothetical protein
MEMPWREAVIKVLQSHPDGLHYTQIAEEIERQGLKKSVGATPAISANVAISLSLRNEESQSPFERIGSGRYRLRPSTLSSKEVIEAPALIEDDEAVPGLIRAFGIHWKREDIEWKTQPRLWGKQQLSSEPIDFCDQRGVYVLYDGRDVIYAGRAIDQSLGKRLFDHTRDRLNGRWDRFSWFGVRVPTPEGKLVEQGFTSAVPDLIVTLEALLIESLEPRLNRKRGDEFRALEFLQVRDAVFDTEAKKKLFTDVFAEFLKKKD